jgi:hypothetical protein
MRFMDVNMVQETRHQASGFTISASGVGVRLQASGKEPVFWFIMAGSDYILCPPYPVERSSPL